MSRHLTTADVLSILTAQKWLPVLRSASSRDAVDTALACRDAGCRTVELTFSTPGVLDAVRTLVDEGLVVGLGTVRTTRQVDEAVQAGASYVVSFHRPEGFVRAAAGHGVLSIAGALTPHEVAAAVDEGTDAVKIFSARLVQPEYLQDLVAVLGPVPIMVTGGVQPSVIDIRRWLDAGAVSVGVGSALGSVARDGHEAVETRAAALMTLA